VYLFERCIGHTVWLKSELFLGGEGEKGIQNDGGGLESSGARGGYS